MPKRLSVGIPSNSMMWFESHACYCHTPDTESSVPTLHIHVDEAIMNRELMSTKTKKYQMI